MTIVTSWCRSTQQRMSPWSIRLLGVAAILVSLLLGATSIIGQDESIDPSELPDTVSGAIGTYVSADGNSFERIDNRLNFDWDDAVPDRRIGQNSFEVTWRATLTVPREGEYRFLLYLQGKGAIAVDGTPVVDGEASEPTWFGEQGRAIHLAAGEYPIEVKYSRETTTGRIGAFWEGSTLYREPLGPVALSHPRATASRDVFRQGEELVRNARCDACHTVVSNTTPLSAPALDRLPGNMQFPWLVKFLTGPSKQRPTEVSHFPEFQLSADEAHLLAQALWDAGETPTVPPTNEPNDLSTDVERGRELVQTIGCLACHPLEATAHGAISSFGMAFDQLVGKRPQSFFVRWLADPASINRDHRMPLFTLTTQEQHDIGAFLNSQTVDRDMAESSTESTVVEPTQGTEREQTGSRDWSAARELLGRFRCQACHRLPETLTVATLPAVPPWDTDISFNRGCLSPPAAQSTRPFYDWDRSVRQIVADYLNNSLPGGSGERDADQRPLADATATDRQLRELGCLQCHARGDEPGISAIALQLSDTERKYRSLLPAMVPPSLEMVGDKLTNAALAQALEVSSPTRRPWLAIRMPRFRLNGAAITHLAEGIARVDRLPAWNREISLKDDKSYELAGTRLVTTEGLGCTSCHAIGDFQPAKGALNTKGPDLADIGQRIRPDWFQRWVRNPLRIIPRVEMPAVEVPVPGVLHGQLNAQLDAVWHVLNQPGFRPPVPDAVRVVRQSGRSTNPQRAEVLTDLMKVGPVTLIKPMMVALPNRHNVLFDWERNQLVSWSVGDAARQRNNGKVWYWEPAGTPVVEFPAGHSEISLRNVHGTVAPRRIGQAECEIDAWSHAGGGVTIKRRLQFPPELSTTDQEQKALDIVRLMETVAPIANSTGENRTGWTRSLQVSGVPRGSRVALQLVPTDSAERWTWHPELGTYHGRQRGGHETTIRVPSGQSNVVVEGMEVLLGPANSKDDALTLVLQYETNIRNDTYESLPAGLTPTESAIIDGIPGFHAIRLGLPTDIMPTVAEIAPDGSLVVASLKGNIWRVPPGQTGQSPLVVQPVSDELAAPYGLACGPDYVDVVTKSNVVRLSQFDEQGRATTTEVIASGWGHTADYHDWAVGLPRDEAGNYWIALPCHQDERSLEAAYLRGRVLQLVPQTPSEDLPRRFRLVEVSAGHRFPMGIALNRAGQVFVTDNQGNYNPFNELNHVLPGNRYGFINATEREAEITKPTSQPAIAIPHPWTRSVNGICFLETPEALRRQINRDWFGPFEGHIIGCEYDTRRLVRMSLQFVDGQFQGAVYPLSREPTAAERSLLGPVNCSVGPEGALYIAELRDAGWGSGPNIGAIVRLDFAADTLPTGIAEVRTVADGLRVTWTRPIDPHQSAEMANYAVSSYTRITTPNYGGPDVQRRQEKLLGIAADKSGQFVTLQLEPLRRGFVYELRVRRNRDGRDNFFPDEAYITVH